MSAGHEVVEVNGFTFVRKRKPTTPDLDNQPESKKFMSSIEETQQEPAPVVDPATTSQNEASQQGSYQVQQAENQLNNQQQNAPQQPPEDQPQELPGTGPIDQEPGTPAPLQAITPIDPILPPSPEQTEHQLHDELSNCLPASCPAAIKVQLVLERVMQFHAKRMARMAATSTATTTTPAESAPTNATRLAGASKHIAHKFSSLLQQEIEQGQQMLLQAEGGLETFEMLPNMLKQMSQGSRLKASLQLQLQHLQQEEDAWLQVQHKYTAQGQGQAQGEGCAQQEGGSEQVDQEPRGQAQEGGADVDSGTAVASQGQAGEATSAAAPAVAGQQAQTDGAGAQSGAEQESQSQGDAATAAALAAAAALPLPMSPVPQQGQQAQQQPSVLQQAQQQLLADATIKVGHMDAVKHMGVHGTAWERMEPHGCTICMRELQTAWVVCMADGSVVMIAIGICHKECMSAVGGCKVKCGLGG